MKIVLTGATGFIGGHVMNYLANLGYEVDYISTKEFMNNDWTKLDTKPDVVIHIAWIREADLQSHRHLEFATWSCNFLDECKKRGIRVINIGSSSEYGTKNKPMKENMICEPRNTYGIGQLMVTLHAKNLGYNTLRLFTVYGEGGYSFYDICKKAERFTTRTDCRDYISIDYVCIAIEKLIHAQHIYSEIINICCGVPIRNWQVAELLLKDINYSSRWWKYPIRQFEPFLWYGDPGKMIGMIGLRPRDIWGDVVVLNKE